jgi:hypothetical protein
MTSGVLRMLSVAGAFLTATVLAHAATPTPVIYLNMDGNFANSGSGSAYTATLTDAGGGLGGTPTSAAGIVGQSMCISPGLIGRYVGTGNAEVAKAEGNMLAINYKLPDHGTIAMWYNFDPNMYCMQYMVANSSSYTSAFQMYSDANSIGARTNDYWYDGTFYPPGLGSATPALTSGWHHVAFTWNKHASDQPTTTHAMVDCVTYLDGVSYTGTPTQYAWDEGWQSETAGITAHATVSGSTVTDAWWNDPGNTVYIGGGPNSQCANGYFDEVRIYDTVLTASQVAGLTVPEPGTLGLAVSGLIGLLAYAWRKRR